MTRKSTILIFRHLIQPHLTPHSSVILTILSLFLIFMVRILLKNNRLLQYSFCKLLQVKIFKNFTCSWILEV